MFGKEDWGRDEIISAAKVLIAKSSRNYMVSIPLIVLLSPIFVIPLLSLPVPVDAIADSDGDSLFDIWETSGIDRNGDGTIDLTLPRADPMHKDMYIEVDYMQNHRPRQDALDHVVESFQNAPVPNPDGNTGINLHIVVDEEVPHQDSIQIDSDNSWPGFDSIKNTKFGTATQRAAANSADILAAKKDAYHYTLFAHTYSQSPPSSGKSEIFGNDFIVSLGYCVPNACWARDPSGHVVGNTDQQEGTFMHELGHNLALRHGGDDGINCKPNYLSVMSYSLQFRNADPGRFLDYSTDALPILHEDLLAETDGVQGPVKVYAVYGVPDPSDPNRHVVKVDRALGPIDWNDNGQIDRSTDLSKPGVRADVNRLIGSGCGDPSPDETLTGFNDWLHIRLDFRNSPNFQEGTHAGAGGASITEPEMTIQEVNDIAKNVDFDNDKLANFFDNCPAKPNPDQTDADKDGIGNACDSTNEPLKKPPATSPSSVSNGTSNVTTTTTPLSPPSNSNSSTTQSLKRDATPPEIISFTGSVEDGDAFYFGDVPDNDIKCDATDATSGLDGTCQVTGYETEVGEHTLTATAKDNAGNEATKEIKYTVKEWTIKGFYDPVDMNDVVNRVKSGLTVPLKFEVFAGDEDKKTDTAAVVDSFTQKKISCSSLADEPTDAIENTATGETELTYDESEGQYVQNWKTPSESENTCWKVTLTTDDGSSIAAYFKLTE